jgi:beta-phosphoglucomutase-like phosphatase (HAD superfamily)
VDGVLLASPHEQAWREALQGLADPERFTTAMYQAQVAGRPRLDGALAALEALGVADAVRLSPIYAASKQARLTELVARGDVQTFPDALRFVRAVKSLGLQTAVASSSKNANAMMLTIPMGEGQSLMDMFTANECGVDLTHGKPDPEIFLLAARALGLPPETCVVIEDAPAGIQAALAGGMAALGVARLGDAAGLWDAGANLVVANLDEVSIDNLARGRLCQVTARMRGSDGTRPHADR